MPPPLVRTDALPSGFALVMPIGGCFATSLGLGGCFAVVVLLHLGGCFAAGDLGDVTNVVQPYCYGVSFYRIRF